MTNELRLGPYTLPLGQRTLIMGILNVTPDSFSDGGNFYSVENALHQAQLMANEGADIIDVGGESTRPGSTAISATEEIERVLPVIKALRKEIDRPVSIDTYKASVAAAALKEGAHMINDVWGFRGDPQMAHLAAETGVAVCLMHNRQEAVYKDNLLSEVIKDLRECLETATRAGVKKENIVIDPGIGFGKTLAHNLILMHRLAELKSLGYPMLLGTSRKSMIGKVLDLPAADRLEGTAATVALGIAAGADIIRVHDVKEMRRVAIMTDAIVRNQQS